MFDTKLLLSRSPLLWAMMHSQGSLTVEASRKTSACVCVNDYPTLCKEFCYDPGRYVWAGGELTKAQMTRVDELEFVNEGARRCKFMGEWR